MAEPEHTILDFSFHGANDNMCLNNWWQTQRRNSTAAGRLSVHAGRFNLLYCDGYARNSPG